MLLIHISFQSYGDKAPKSITGRGFSIFWILAGITICSMFTAALTDVITSAGQTTKNQLLPGKKVNISDLSVGYVKSLYVENPTILNFENCPKCQALDPHFGARTHGQILVKCFTSMTRMKISFEYILFLIRKNI